MKLVTITFADYLTGPDAADKQAWNTFLLAHGIDSQRVVRVRPSEDQKADVYEVED